MPILPKKVVQELSEYPPALEGRRDYARLDSCENTSGFPSAYPDGLPDQWISAYPEYGELIKRIAAKHNVTPENILITNGSDEAIYLVCSTFIEPGVDNAIVSNPCFVVIPHSLKLSGATLKVVNVRPDLSFDTDGIETALSEGAKIAFFATPENPTGALLDGDTVMQWCKKFPDTLIAIDEAYTEFSGTTLVPRLSEAPNLVILRTFSKAWGMAGLRLGYCLGDATIIAYMRRVRLLYNVNSAAVWTALKLLDQGRDVEADTKDAMQRKAKILEELDARGFETVRGAANSFLLYAAEAAEEFQAYCRERKVLVRNRSYGKKPVGDEFNPMWGMVRVSVGTPDENCRFLAALDEFAKTQTMPRKVREGK
jgi:histidinol-phosphate aminotransferase